MNRQLVKITISKALNKESVTEIKADSNATVWEEMVFENRNQDYGAFIIRQLYVKHIFRGLLVTLSLLALAILYPFIVSLFTSNVPDLMNVGPLVIQVEMTQPPPIQIDQPKLAAAPKVKAAEKNAPPEVVKEEIPEQKEQPKLDEPKEKTEDQTSDEEGSTTGTETGTSTTDVKYEVYERKAFFPGGEKATREFIVNNTHYPINALRARVEGTVFVSFYVNEDGSLENVKAIRGFLKECDREAERVVRSMMKWEPALQGGKPIRTTCSVTVVFKVAQQSPAIQPN